MRNKKRQRQSELQSLLDYYPFLTDQELAEKFLVSIQTIRLDRMELGIPELRERVKMVANDAYAKIKSSREEEIIGNLQDYEAGARGVSSLDIGMDMVYERTMTARAEYIFAQANSLAALAADCDEAMTVDASIQFLRPVYAGERLVCTATVVEKQEQRVVVAVATIGSQTEVFKGSLVLETMEG